MEGRSAGRTREGLGTNSTAQLTRDLGPVHGRRPAVLCRPGASGHPPSHGGQRPGELPFRAWWTSSPTKRCGGALRPRAGTPAPFALPGCYAESRLSDPRTPPAACNIRWNRSGSDGGRRHEDGRCCTAYDLVVVGGGVWGVAAALAAVRAEQGAVLLLEARPAVASESSAKSGAIVSDVVATPDDQRWVQRSRALFREAQAANGDQTMIRQHGMLSLGTPSYRGQMAEHEASLRERGIPVEVWPADEIRRRFPELDRVENPVFGVWTPYDWHVNPTSYAFAVLDMAKTAGLTVKLSYRVTTLRIEDREVLLEGPNDTIHAARVLLTAGTWTRKLLQTAGMDLPLRPYRTQLASLEVPGGYHLPIVRNLATDMYIVPDGPHNMLVGDGTQLWEHDPDAYRTTGDPEFEQSVAEGVMSLSSHGEQARLRRSWAGLCGATPDRRPLIGPVGDRVWVACGDNGFGIKRGPAIGELAAEMALGMVPPASHLLPNRYPNEDFILRPGQGGSL